MDRNQKTKLSDEVVEQCRVLRIGYLWAIGNSVDLNQERVEAADLIEMMYRRYENLRLDMVQANKIVGEQEQRIEELKAENKMLLDIYLASRKISRHSPNDTWKTFVRACEIWEARAGKMSDKTKLPDDVEGMATALRVDHKCYRAADMLEQLAREVHDAGIALKCCEQRIEELTNDLRSYDAIHVELESEIGRLDAALAEIEELFLDSHPAGRIARKARAGE